MKELDRLSTVVADQKLDRVTDVMMGVAGELFVQIPINIARTANAALEQLDDKSIWNLRAVILTRFDAAVHAASQA